MTNVFSAKRLLIVLCLLCCDLPGHAADISISSAKLLPDSTDTSISLSSKVVTYAAADYFYIEEDTRNMGIRIDKVAHGLTVGMRADITGTMTTTADNERAVLASIATQTPAPNATGVIAPVSMNNLTLGGADWQVSGTGGQKGTSASTDLNNIGLLVKTWGRCQQVDATHFTIDDGSGLDIRCSVAPGTTLSSAWEKVIVTGISSVYKSTSATYLPMVLVRDIQVNLPITYSTEMIYIPGGSFLMGNNGSEPYSYPDELPQHSVYVSSYWIGKYEVTRGEYRAFMNATGRAAPRYWDAVQTWQTGQTFTQTENHPVVGVTWDDAQAYCAWAGGRLPTEAEWEKAARWTGSSPNVYPWGNTWDAEKCNNWDDTNSAGGGYQSSQTAPVGSYPSGASPYGCQDMAGNVWEWCQDWYQSNYYSQNPASDPQGPTDGSYRVLRGGSWNDNDADSGRAALRSVNYSYDIWYYLGFRVARVESPQPGETVSVPGTPTGNTSPVVNVSEAYTTTSATSSQGHIVEYSFDWGDGVSSPWSTSTTASHSWTTTGAITVTVTARCQSHSSISSTSAWLRINVTDAVNPGEMIYIPAGDFLMGNTGSEPYSYTDEFPQHSVYLSSYCIGKYEVTRGEYRAFMTATGRAAPAYWDATQMYGGQPFTQTENHPVVGVTYYDATAYCAWAGGRLPTEAEWEKAARWTGSRPNAYPWGNTWDTEKCNNYLDHNSAGGGYQRSQTAPVGSYPNGASPYGCQDMAGNVWEWCKDWYQSNYYSHSPTSDPQGPTNGTYRVLRGGGWDIYDYSSRCVGRYGDDPNSGWDSGGFRLAR